LFLYPSESTTIILGYTGTFEKRMGGDVLVMDGKQNSLHQYFEKNKTKRHSGEFIVESNLSTHVKGTIKASLSDFDRRVQTNSHFFHGKEWNYYTEASALLTGEKVDWVGGVNFIGDKFSNRLPHPAMPMSGYRD
jgi:iron complex outermembrane receptor protein/outer membrane receptor for ferrienterochelin and colicins